MPINLRIYLIIFALFLVLLTFSILRKGRIPEKYSLIWFFIAFIILLVGIVPNFVDLISELLGFEVMANMITAIILLLMTFVTMSLTIIVSGQKKKITLLIQEVSLLKKELEEKK